MIYEKSVELPKFRRRNLTKRLSLFREKNGALFCKGAHFQTEGGEIVLAEGLKQRGELSLRPTAVYPSAGQGNAVFFATGDHTLTEWNGERQFAGVPELNRLLSFQGERGEIFLGVRESGAELLEGGMSFSVHGAAGGKDGCIFCERLVTARGDTVYWSKPLSPQNWTRSLQEAGHVSLPSSKGEILSLLPFADSVCILREAGIDRLFMGGDATAFRMESVPYAGGRIFKRSAALCGGEAIFFAENGLYRFDGARAKRMQCGCFFEIDPKKEVQAVSASGRYFASVSGKNGEKYLFCYFPEEDEAHLLAAEAELLAGGRELILYSKGKVYTLEGRALPNDPKRHAQLFIERTNLGLSSSRKFLDGISIGGEGKFYLEARGEHHRRAVCGEAGVRLLFPVPVRGESFSFLITAESDRAKIGSLTFHLREEAETW